MSGNPNNDGDSIAPLPDAISGLRWSPTCNMLAATCWDGQAYIWDVQRADNAVPKACKEIGGPAFCSAWQPDGMKLFVGGATPRAKAWDLDKNEMSDVAVHDQPIRCMVFVEAVNNMLATGSWDKTVRYWDVRQPTGQFACNLDVGERVYAMDAIGNLMVVGTAARQVIIYDLRSPDREFRRKDSPLKYQTRAISCFPDLTGFAMSSIEGRVAIHYLEEQPNRKNFAFKCHRKGHHSNDVYPVNDIHFNVMGTFATCGSDGTIHFWDKDVRQRVKAFKGMNQSIPCCRFSQTSELFAYAVGYDWHKGASSYNSQHQNRIYIHAVQRNEIEPKKK